MSIPKVVGIEQEYAITIKGGDDLSAFHASCMLVNGYARKAGLRGPGIETLWDYDHETPFQDIRGELFSRKSGRDITRKEDNLLINAALPNGARLYTDHAHPEYSTPECLGAREAAACDKAGELILASALELAKEAFHPVTVDLFKNNVDHQGQSYGCHENYLLDAGVHQEYFVDDPAKAQRTLIPYLVTRQVFAGSGKPGTSFQISQRADFMESLFGLDTMFKRPIINTRQEHHADPKRFRRLHLILGDSNMSEFASILKIGATQIVLQMMEDGFITDNFSLKDPVQAVKRVSARFDCELELADGKKTTALDLQRRFLDLALEYRLRRDVAHVPQVDSILEAWTNVLDGLAELKMSPDMDLEDDPRDMSRKLDWVLKLWLLTRYRRRKSLSWDHPQLKVLDLEYHNIDRGKSIFYSLQRQGLTETILRAEETAAYVDEPPAATRAWFRGKCLRKFPQEVYLINWEVVGFDHGDIHRMVPLLNPLKGTRERFQQIFDQAANSKELLDMLAKLNS
ncbi:MAG: proteasome accessory factor PafA2 family protein [Syntrophobacteraceae bacterium]|nr:proteasome accessory factor PafA2 family protein [Syntrophobacteraceae bacterium]